MFPGDLDSWPHAERLAFVAGYLHAAWAYSVWRNGTAIVGTAERPYREVFVEAIDRAALLYNTTLRRELHDRGVVVPLALPASED